MNNIDKDRLYWEREALLDETAEKLRQGASYAELQEIMMYIEDEYNECLRQIKEGVSIDEVIEAYRGLTHLKFNDIL